MPLGSNIKRDKLIPADKEEKKEGKAVAKKKKTTKGDQSAKKKVVTKSKRGVTKKAVKEPRKKVAKKPDTTVKPTKQSVIQTPQAETVMEPQVIVKEVPVQVIAEPRKIFQKPMLTPEQIEQRQKLREKYVAEINSLRGTVQQMISFQLGSDKYAIEIGKIKEVVPTPTVSRIPHAPDFIKGVANIRGSMMVILDLAQKFELTEEKEFKSESLPFTMVIESPLLKVGVLVKEVPVTLKVLGDIIESSSGLLNNTALEETYIKGLIKLKDDVIIYIDIIDLIESEEVKIAAQAAVN